ncbi:Uncharacterised protein [Burkholderia pseudomallei]|nr:Uncharacterised protein [Burkholderia pseudomallei]
MKLSTSQIGRCGELLAQYLLLLRGIDSAPMTTDMGIDLVAYSPISGVATTIQVKANLKAKPGGGKGKLALDWWMPVNCPAQLIALVDLSAHRLWLLKTEEIEGLAQQRSGGRFHLYMYTDSSVRPLRIGRSVYSHEFEKYLLENRVQELFGAGEEAILAGHGEPS